MENSSGISKSDKKLVGVDASDILSKNIWSKLLSASGPIGNEQNSTSPSNRKSSCGGGSGKKRFYKISFEKTDDGCSESTGGRGRIRFLNVVSSSPFSTTTGGAAIVQSSSRTPILIKKSIKLEEPEVEAYDGDANQKTSATCQQQHQSQGHVIKNERPPSSFYQPQLDQGGMGGGITPAIVTDQSETVDVDGRYSSKNSSAYSSPDSRGSSSLEDSASSPCSPHHNNNNNNDHLCDIPLDVSLLQPSDHAIRVSPAPSASAAATNQNRPRHRHRRNGGDRQNFSTNQQRRHRRTMKIVEQMMDHCNNNSTNDSDSVVTVNFIAAEPRPLSVPARELTNGNGGPYRKSSAPVSNGYHHFVTTSPGPDHFYDRYGPLTIDEGGVVNAVAEDPNDLASQYRALDAAIAAAATSSLVSPAPSAPASSSNTRTTIMPAAGQSATAVMTHVNQLMPPVGVGLVDNVAQPRYRPIRKRLPPADEEDRHVAATLISLSTGGSASAPSSSSASSSSTLDKSSITYLWKRERNNEAVKRSRAKSKLMQEHIRIKYRQLETENRELRNKLDESERRAEAAEKQRDYLQTMIKSFMATKNGGGGGGKPQSI